MATINDPNFDADGTVNGVQDETNILYGWGGADILNAANMGDLMIGGLGDDTYNGGVGADSVRLQWTALSPTDSFGHDVWTNFNVAEGDRIDVSLFGNGQNEVTQWGIGDFNTIKSIASLDNNGKVRLTFGASSLTLNTLTDVSQLTASMFIFSTADFDDVVFGSIDNDFLYGGLGDDTIFGDQGADQLFGEQDDDTLSGGAGNDFLIGGAGLDKLDGGANNDYLTGGTQADQVKFSFFTYTNGTASSGSGTDRWLDFNAAEGDKIDVSGYGFNLPSAYSDSIGEFDTVLTIASALGGGGKLLTWGTSFLQLPTASSLTASMFKFDTRLTETTFNLGTGNDFLAAAGGDDAIDGNNGNDKLFGEQGNDTINGGAGTDKIYGGTGNDTINPGNGYDEVYGGDGNDTIYTSHKTDEKDKLFGGKGNDRYIINSEGENSLGYYGSEIFERANEGIDTAVYLGEFYPINPGIGFPLPAPYELAAHIENAEGKGKSFWLNGNALNNVITGTTTASIWSNNIDGKGGNDTLYGQGLEDLLYGGTGDDELHGRSGNDTLDGGANNDDIYGGAGNDKISGSVGTDNVFGGTGDDTLSKMALGENFFDGEAGSDTVNLYDATNKLAVILNGSTYAKVYVNGVFNDQIKNVENLIGGKYNDTFSGDSFVNRLDGGLGNDVLYGRGGADKFIFSQALSAANVDRIGDFKASDDKIVLSKYIFAKIGVTLTAGEFVIGTKALQADDYIIYNNLNGSLYYDDDGSNTATAAVKFAQLDPVSAGVYAVLNHTHFILE